MSVSPPAAVVFDMDGVVTRTAGLHAAAWKELFDPVLRAYAERTGTTFRPFDLHSDYLTYVDGRPRQDGARSFLASRGIVLPEGEDSDPPERETIRGLARRKDAFFARALQHDGAQVYPSSIDLIRQLRSGGISTGIVTSSRHGAEVLQRAGIENLFDARLDGNDLAARRIRGKPAPDAFLECARMLGAPVARSVLVEDAVVGVEAGRLGGFGLVVGVDRGGNREALAANGADVVVSDLAELDADKLATQLYERRKAIAWRVEQEGFDPAREHEMESLFVVGNGYLGVRGAPDTPLPGSLDDLFIAGIYGRKQTELPSSKLDVQPRPLDEHAFDELVSLPFPFRLRLRVGGAALELEAGGWTSNVRVLDLRQGVLESRLRFEVNGERTSLRTHRCASLADLHLLLQEIKVELENHSAHVELDSSLEDPQLAEGHPHVEKLPTRSGDSSVDLAHFRTKDSAFEIALASRTSLLGGGSDSVRWSVQGQLGQTLTFRRIIVVYTTRDVQNPVAAALEHVNGFDWGDYDAAVHAHVGSWGDAWAHADVQIPDRPAVEQALRFNAYHLRSAADHDPRVSIGARTLSGRGYEGHVFWDVEIFMLPFFTHTFPNLAEYLLRYRHRTLDGARRRAGELGFRGACYAWESTVTGEDVTPHEVVLKTTGKQIPLQTGTEQIHVTADVAFGIWRYWEASGDREFLRDAGVEIFAETARFWASRCKHEADGYHIRGVIGPDEYHRDVSDNAYTNWMARLNLEKAVWACEWLAREFPQHSRELAGRLSLTSEEPNEWAKVARELYCPQPGANGVIEQFAGFFNLEEYDLAGEDRSQGPVDRLFEWDRINGLKLIKQADVLMLLHLLPELFPQDVVLANYRYYEPRTDHASSLSPAIHAAIAARLHLREDAERFWRQSLWMDLSNSMGNSALGVHAASMGGVWQALVFGFLGVRFAEEGPIAAADAALRMPEGWQSVALNLAWRGRHYPLEVRR